MRNYSVAERKRVLGDSFPHGNKLDQVAGQCATKTHFYIKSYGTGSLRNNGKNWSIDHFTIDLYYLHYSVIQRGCEVISGRRYITAKS